MLIFSFKIYFVIHMSSKLPIRLECNENSINKDYIMD